jgi:hypothetical protein
MVGNNQFLCFILSVLRSGYMGGCVVVKHNDVGVLSKHLVSPLSVASRDSLIAELNR